MTDQILDRRKQRVLQAIIEDYVATAEPVGSRAIARRYDLGVSPATIRNEMADLEEMGYLDQPHTSAGRIPSDRGYRYYVDRLLGAPRLSPAEAGRIRRFYQRKVEEIESLVHLTVKLLSETTRYTSLVTAPQLSRTRLKSLRILPLGEGKGLMVLVTDAGLVENRVIDLPANLGTDELERFSNLLDRRLRRVALSQVSRGLLREVQEELSRYQELLERTVALLARAVETLNEERIYLAGATNIMTQPEFRDVDKVRTVLVALEQEKVVHDLLSHGGDEGGVRVFIGEENLYREVQECSLVAATYYIGSQVVGHLGVLGPKRMEYGKAIAAVELVTRNLSEMLTRYFKGR